MSDDETAAAKPAAKAPGKTTLTGGMRGRARTGGQPATHVAAKAGPRDGHGDGHASSGNDSIDPFGLHLLGQCAAGASGSTAGGGRSGSPYGGPISDVLNGDAIDSVALSIGHILDNVLNDPLGIDPLGFHDAPHGAHERGLSGSERSYAIGIFSKSVDYDKVRITRGHVASIGACRTIGNTIHLTDDCFTAGSPPSDLTVNPVGMWTLIHEMTHVWQYQHGGIDYIPQSLWAQLKSTITTGGAKGAYDYDHLIAKGVPWESWNPEQQAELVEDYNIAVRAVEAAKASGGVPDKDGVATVNRLLPYIDKLRAGIGAPKSIVSGSNGNELTAGAG